jgi:hypothetical protein
MSVAPAHLNSAGNRGIKPLNTDCSCHPYGNLVRIGRFGTWQKEVLVTDAYKTAQQELALLRMSRS